MSGKSRIHIAIAVPIIAIVLGAAIIIAWPSQPLSLPHSEIEGTSQEISDAPTQTPVHQEDDNGRDLDAETGPGVASISPKAVERLFDQFDHDAWGDGYHKLTDPGSRKHCFAILVRAFPNVAFEHYAQALNSGGPEYNFRWSSAFRTLAEDGDIRGFPLVFRQCGVDRFYSGAPLQGSNRQHEMSADSHELLSIYVRFPELKQSITSYALKSLGLNNHWNRDLVKALGASGDPGVVATLEQVEQSPQEFANLKQHEDSWQEPILVTAKHRAAMEHDLKLEASMLKDEATKALQQIHLATVDYKEVGAGIRSGKQFIPALAEAERRADPRLLSAIRARLDDAYMFKGKPRFSTESDWSDFVTANFMRLYWDDLDPLIHCTYRLGGSLSEVEQRRLDYWGIRDPMTYIRRTGLLEHLQDSER